MGGRLPVPAEERDGLLVGEHAQVPDPKGAVVGAGGDKVCPRRGANV